MTLIDKYSYINPLKKWHPSEKITLSLCGLIVSLSSNSVIIPSVLMLIFSYLIVNRAKIPFTYLLKLMFIPFFFLLTSFFVIIFDFTQSNSFYQIPIFDFGITVSQSNLEKGVSLIFRSLSAVLCLYFLTLTTPFIDMLQIIKKMKGPDFFIDLLYHSYQFTFLIFNTAHSMFQAQLSRMGYSNFKNSLRSQGLLISGLIVYSLRQSQAFYMSLEARNYSGQLSLAEDWQDVSFTRVFLIILLGLSLVALEQLYFI